MNRLTIALASLAIAGLLILAYASPIMFAFGLAGACATMALVEAMRTR